jgi:hypothetical protein
MNDEYQRRVRDIVYFTQHEDIQNRRALVDTIGNMLYLINELEEAIVRLENTNEHLSAALGRAAKTIK